MTVSVAQHGNNSGSGAASLSVTLNGVTAGSCLNVQILDDTSNARTFTVSDDVNGSYGAHLVTENLSGRTVWIYHFPDSAAGNVEVTVTPDIATRFSIGFAEIQGVGPSPSFSVNQFQNTTTGPEYCADPTGLTFPDGSLSIGVHVPIAAPSVYDQRDSYLEIYKSVAFPIGMSMYREWATGQTGHRPTIDMTPTTFAGPGISIAYEPSAAPPAFNPAWARQANRTIQPGTR